MLIFTKQAQTYSYYTLYIITMIEGHILLLIVFEETLHVPCVGESTLTVDEI